MSPMLYIIVAFSWISQKTPEKDVFFPVPSPREILNVDYFVIIEAVFIRKGGFSYPL